MKPTLYIGKAGARNDKTITIIIATIINRGQLLSLIYIGVCG